MTRFVPRRHPAKGVLITRDRATIVFLTISSKHRANCFAQQTVHDALLSAWADADAWMVGAYLLMPDHLHLFCSPMDEEIEIERWITFWKRRFRHHIGADGPRFQADSFHHRLRSEESYSEKWEYVRQNPVRAGLVSLTEEWPHQGVLSELRC